MHTRVEDWGRDFPIGKALELQDKLWAEKVFKNTEDLLIFVEHEPVYSAGASLARNLEGIKRSFKKELCELPAPIVVTRRGGLVTYQGPGILSIYCIFKLNKTSPKDLNKILLESSKKMLKTYGISAHQNCSDPGLYIGLDKKIVSVGTQLAKNVSRFGMTVSINPEPKYLEPLIPCGLQDIRMTSMIEELGKPTFDSAEKNAIKVVLASEVIARFC